ncbi:MAG: chemotaxis response regulator protein-glutamate methylesterase [Nitrospirae bacterium]|nr:MAG: chemotaxis response regulator protein-glutamate methylesterase [Nitrospirota bacterium]
MIQVMIIDDSPAIRAQFRGLLEAEPDMEVVAEAEDPIVARRLLDRVSPDVITLDVEMPRMDGLAFLRKLMAGRPTPVVMASTLTQHGAEVTLEALRIGAVAAVGKPTPGHPASLEDFAEELVREVRAAAAARVGRSQPRAAGPRLGAVAGGGRLVAIGASTGGTEAIRAILARLPAACPPIAIVQHMPAGFTATFAAHLDREVAPRVVEAADGMALGPGTVAVAPGDAHLEVAAAGGGWRLAVVAGERVNRHRPSVDVLFHSVARAAGPRAVGVLLTGMGADGAAGLKAMRDAGAHTLAQDRESCTVYGMPRAAVQLGAAEAEVPLERMAHAILKAAAHAGASARAPIASQS